MSESILALNNVYKSINGKEILKNISFKVNKGEIHGFIGPNGAGKTTTMRCALALLNTDKGVCSVFGQNTQKCIQKNFHRIGVILDEGGLYEDLSALDNILFFASLYKLKKDEIVNKFHNLCEYMQLNTDNKKVAYFSKGMKQKLLIIKELIHSPDLLILDEPFTGLDPASRIFFRDKLKTLQQKGTTIFLSSHDLYDMEQIASNITLIKDGSIQLSDSYKNIIDTSNNQLVYVVKVPDVNSFIEKAQLVLKFEVISVQNNKIKIKVNKNQHEPLKYLVNANIEVTEFYSENFHLENFFKSL